MLLMSFYFILQYVMDSGPG